MGFDMKRITLLILGLIVMSVDAWAQIPDLPTNHAIITYHKQKYEELGDKQSRVTVNAGLAAQVKSVSEDVSELQKNLSERMKMGYYYIGYAYQTINILIDLQSIISNIDDYVGFFAENVFENALIYQWYESSIKGIKEEIDKCQKIIIGGTLIKANHSQKVTTLNQIEASLTIIRQLMERTLWMCEGLVALDMSYQESFVKVISSPSFEAKVENYANQLISTYSKEK